MGVHIVNVFAERDQSLLDYLVHNTVQAALGKFQTWKFNFNHDFIETRGRAAAHGSWV